MVVDAVVVFISKVVAGASVDSAGLRVVDGNSVVTTTVEEASMLVGVSVLGAESSVVVEVVGRVLASELSAEAINAPAGVATAVSVASARPTRLDRVWRRLGLNEGGFSFRDILSLISGVIFAVTV